MILSTESLNQGPGHVICIYDIWFCYTWSYSPSPSSEGRDTSYTYEIYDFDMHSVFCPTYVNFWAFCKFGTLSDVCQYLYGVYVLYFVRYMISSEHSIRSVLCLIYDIIWTFCTFDIPSDIWSHLNVLYVLCAVWRVTPPCALYLLYLFEHAVWERKLSSLGILIDYLLFCILSAYETGMYEVCLKGMWLVFWYIYI